MARPILNPDEAALWARLIATVKPLRVRAPTKRDATPLPVRPEPVEGRPGRAVQPSPASTVSAKRGPPFDKLRANEREGGGLDSGWDRRLSRGHVLPDRLVDLHGHTLASAHALLDNALDRAIGGDARVVLLITGKPPRPESLRPHARGAIRAAVGDWLAASRHASSIASVRNAHPRHGGAGALYIILRRKRS